MSNLDRLNLIDSESDEEERKSFTYYETQSPQRLHHFYLCNVIGEPIEYVDMVHKIRNANANDIIHIHLNTPGGYLSTTIQIISAMKACQAHVVTIVEGMVHSAGTSIFLHGDEMVIHDHCQFMIHNHSGGQFGKGHEYMAEAVATTKWFEDFARDTYIGFLSEIEFEQMINGKDFWFNSAEVRKRLKKFVNYLKEQQKEAEQEIKEKVIKRKTKNETTLSQ